MNLINFLHKVDEKTKGLDKEQLQSFIFELAREITEGRREDILCMLDRAAGEEQVNKDFLARWQEGIEFNQEAIKPLMDKLEEIIDGKYHLNSGYNEDYCEWDYCSEEPEFEFSDPEGILPVIGSATEMLDKLIDQARYEEAYNVSEKLLAIDLEVDGEYADYGGDSLNLWSLSMEGLLQIDCERTFSGMLMSVYKTVAPEERPSEVFEMIRVHGQDVNDCLTNLFSFYGNELDDWDAFLLALIDYLGNESGHICEELLEEAVNMILDKKPVVELARKYANRHPIIYWQILSKKPEEAEAGDWYALGREAMENMKADYWLRSQIALQTADYALACGHKADAEECWLEALRSDTTPANYMRMVVECEDFTRYLAQMEEIRLTAKLDNENYGYRYWESLESRKNGAWRGTDPRFMAIAGKFSEAVKAKDSDNLIFLLMAHIRSGNLSDGGKWLCNRLSMKLNFVDEDYKAGLGGRYEGERNLFLPVFMKWAERMPIEDEIIWTAIEKISKQIDRRVEQVLSEKARKEYHECAAMLAAWGEAEEALGKTGRKQQIMGEYQDKYRRFSAFKAELKVCGWKG